MKLKEIRQAVRAELLRFGLEQKADFAIDYVVNQGAAVFARETRIIRKTQTIDVQAGTADYTLQASALEVLQARYDNRPLDVTGPEELARYYDRWPEAPAGRPYAYYLYDSRTIRLFPTPADALASGLKIDLVAGWAYDLSGDDDEPETGPSGGDAAKINGLPARYHLVLVYYAAKQIALPQVADKDQGPAAAIAELEQRYQQLLDEARADAAGNHSRGIRRVPFRSF
jgi:hypothetical protein